MIPRSINSPPSKGTNQLTSLINLSIDTGVCPDSLEKSQITPLHKTNDPLSKTNNRPAH
jgi:hypothetical protein